MISPATFYPDTATTLGRLEKKQAGVSELCHKTALWRALPPDGCPGLSPTSFTFPTNLLAVQRDSCLSVEWPQHKLRCDLWLAGVPKRQPCCGVACAQSKGAVGGSRRSPLTGTTPCLRRCRRVCPGVSVCGRAGLPEERGQAGGAPTAPDSYLDLRHLRKSRSLQNLDFYSKLEAPGLLASRLL